MSKDEQKSSNTPKDGTKSIQTFGDGEKLVNLSITDLKNPTPPPPKPNVESKGEK